MFFRSSLTLSLRHVSVHACELLFVSACVYGDKSGWPGFRWMSAPSAPLWLALLLCTLRCVHASMSAPCSRSYLARCIRYIHAAGDYRAADDVGHSRPFCTSAVCGLYARARAKPVPNANAMTLLSSTHSKRAHKQTNITAFGMLDGKCDDGVFTSADERIEK